MNNVLKKLLGLGAGIIAVVASLMFFMVAFAVIVAVALMVWAYFWWKTRKLRRALREQQGMAASGTVIDGEAVVVRETTVQTTHVLAHQRRAAPSPTDGAPGPQDSAKTP